MRLTTARYYTPSHKVIHEHGISPDIHVPMSEQDEADLHYKHMPGALEVLDAQDRERIEKVHDRQLERAVDLLKGVLLYSQRGSGHLQSGGRFGPVRNGRLKPLTLVAIETSCDETSAAVVRDGRPLSNVVSSQIALHAEYGGVVPELATREHLRHLMPATRQAMREAGVTVKELDAVAATRARACPARLWWD